MDDQTTQLPTFEEAADCIHRPCQASFQQVVEQAPDAMVLVGQDGRIEFVNARATVLFDYRREDLLGQPVELLVPDSSRASHQRKVWQYFRDPSSRPIGIGMSLEGRRRDGTTFPAEISLSPLRGESQVSVVAAVRDVTERRRLEQLADKTERLEQEKQQLEERRKFEAKLLQGQKLESLGLMASGVAHDFNNLLVGVLGNASLALLELAPDSPATRYIRLIETAALRAADLTNQMLTYVGKSHALDETVDISELVREMTSLMKSAIGSDVTVQQCLPTGLPPVVIDANQLRQVVMNLITNAAEAQAGSGGTIAISTGCSEFGQEYISQTLLPEARPGTFVFVTVADQGCGMDRQTQAQVFDPFFTTKSVGRGLGLSAVLGIIRANGGTIRVCSEPGRGTTFNVLLRTGEATPTRRPPAPRRGRSFDPGQVALVVDDDPSVLRTSVELLTRLGLTVLSAGSGREALQLLEGSDSIQVALVDLTMPDMDGHETLRQIRKRRPRLPVVLCSGYSRSSLGPSSDCEEIAGYLQKPYTTRELVDTIAPVLSAAPDPGATTS